jgi:hypothetical protein
MKIGSRVRIVSGGMSEFHGHTGVVVSNEHDGPMLLNRVRLDVPVTLPGVGLVEDDLWAGVHLKKLIKRGSIEIG